jgi:hypothetical protein
MSAASPAASSPQWINARILPIRLQFLVPGGIHEFVAAEFVFSQARDLADVLFQAARVMISGLLVVRRLGLDGDMPEGARSGRGWRLAPVVVAGALAAVAGTVLAVALNVATGGTARWFPSMERYALWWTGGATAGVAGAGFLVWWAQRRYDQGLAELIPAVQRPEPWVVDRHAEVNQIVAALRRGGTVGVTTALRGAGGFGKTTIAEMVRG